MLTHEYVSTSLRRQKIHRRRLLQTTVTGLTAAAFAGFAGAAPHGTRAAPHAYADLDTVLQSVIDAGLPGVALSVEQGGEPVYSGVAGYASVESRTPLTASHRFRLGSVAKPFTATTVLQLVDAGVLSLDDTVTRWLDDPTVLAIPNVDHITLWQLLNHTSGVYDFADENDSPLWATYLGETPNWSKVWTNQELLAFADGANHQPYFEPGQSWAYSNTAYVLLGMIVEQVTNNRLADEVATRIIAPLALNDTFLAEGAAIPEGTTDCYHSIGGELINTTEINLSWTWACGWTVATMADFVRFGRATLGGEMVSPTSFQHQFTFVPDPRSIAVGWGMGVWSQPSAYGQVFGMGGDGPGFTANLARLVTHDLTVAVLLNSAGTELGTGQIRDQALGAILGAS